MCYAPLQLSTVLGAAGRIAQEGVPGLLVRQTCKQPLQYNVLSATVEVYTHYAVITEGGGISSA